MIPGFIPTDAAMQADTPPPAPEMGLLKLTEDQKTRMALTICEEIDASESAKGTLPERWERNKKIYNVDPDVTNLHVAEGMQPYNIPLYRQKADRIIGTIHGSITGLYPYVQALDDQDINVDEIERALMGMAEDGGFDLKLKKALEITVNTNIATMRVMPHFERGHVIKLDWIHPGNMMCYPAEETMFSEAKTVGHRYYKMRYKIESEQATGLYYEGNIFGDDDPNSDFHGQTGHQTEKTSIVNPKDGQVELWEVVHECDLEGKGEYKKYLCVVARKEQKLLSCQNFPYSTPWYFDIRISEPDGSVWPSDSPAQVMQGIQLAYSDIHTTLIHGSYAAAFPLVIVSGGSLPVKAKKYGPATLIESPVDVKAQVLGGNFNPGALPEESQTLEEVADAVSGISRLGTGENLPSGTTATAANGLLQAQQESKDNYTESVAPSIQRIWGFLYEILSLHFEEVRQGLGSRFPSELTYGKIDGRTFRFEVTGKSGSSSPSALLGKLQFLASLAVNPQSGLDYMAIVDRIVQALDLPFSTQGLKLAPSSVNPQEILAILQAVAGGQLPPEQAAQAIMTDLQNAQSSAAIAGQGVPPQPGMGGMPSTGPAIPAPNGPGAAFVSPSV